MILSLSLEMPRPKCMFKAKRTPVDKLFSQKHHVTSCEILRAAPDRGESRGPLEQRQWNTAVDAERRTGKGRAYKPNLQHGVYKLCLRPWDEPAQRQC